MSRLHSQGVRADAKPVGAGKIKGVAFLGVVKLLRSRKDEARELLRPELAPVFTPSLQERVPRTGGHRAPVGLVSRGR